MIRIESFELITTFLDKNYEIDLNCFGYYQLSNTNKIYVLFFINTIATAA